jgi:hypothetical protein
LLKVVGVVLFFPSFWRLKTIALISAFYLIIWSGYRSHCLLSHVIFRIYIIPWPLYKLDSIKKLLADIWN